MCHEFVEGVARNLLNIWRMVVPSGDTVRRWIECLTPGDVRSSLLSCNSDVMEKARSMRLPTHPVVCALDCNDRECYGKKTSGLIVGGKHKNGTSWFYRIATSCVVEKGISYLMPVKTDDRIDREVKATHRLRFRHIEWTTAFRCITDTTTLIVIDGDEGRQRKHRSSKSYKTIWSLIKGPNHSEVIMSCLECHDCS
jgi:hypothetical protein